ncbi:MAG TPA: hypothetical protein VJ783_05055 [Pirellulales bacterium]|nr:hypothetical protein [Pirellulales bacterium]
MTDRSATALCLTAVLACLAGCKKPDEIRHYTVPKQEDIDQLAGGHAAPAGPSRMLAAAVLQPHKAWFFKLVGPDETVAAQREPFDALIKSLRFSDSDSPPDWSLPEGWNQRPASGMRYATIEIDADPPLELSVTTLGREEGGDAAYLLANINRWRGQIGLADLAADQLEEQTEQVEYEGGKATLVNLLGQMKPGGPMMSGGAGDAPFAPFASGGSRKPAGPSPLDHAVAPQGAAPGGAPDLHYQVPEGWKEEPASGFRLTSFQVSDGGQKAEVTVVTAGGDLLANVNRWRGQIELDPTTQDQLDRDARPIDVGELQGQYVELTGPKKTTLAVVIQAAGRTWFITLKGDNELAQREADNFKSFVHSLTISPAL